MTPTKIKLHKKSQLLEIHFGDNSYELSAEFLRVHSPSAEVKGHGAGQEVLQAGKRYVNITDLEPIGNYALKITFDDGHDSGLFSWTYLAELGKNHSALWRNYQEKLNNAGKSRDPDEVPVKLIDLT